VVAGLGAAGHQRRAVVAEPDLVADQVQTRVVVGRRGGGDQGVGLAGLQAPAGPAATLNRPLAASATPT
jgi:hypothetical protein